MRLRHLQLSVPLFAEFRTLWLDLCSSGCWFRKLQGRAGLLDSYSCGRVSVLEAKLTVAQSFLSNSSPVLFEYRIDRGGQPESVRVRDEGEGGRGIPSPCFVFPETRATPALPHLKKWI
jgi:hypothetical protein